MGVMTPYKREQGRWVRWACLIGCLVLVLWACVNLYFMLLPADVPADEIWFAPEFMGLRLEVTWHLLPPLALFVIMAAILWAASQKPRVADFLIETEGEIRKVSWPGNKEWMNSSLAVIVTMVLFVIYLFVVDLGLGYLMMSLKIGGF
jgi:preprotein translocase subunit SecE